MHLLSTGLVALLLSAGTAHAGSFYLIDAGTKAMTTLDRNAVRWEGNSPTFTMSIFYAHPQMLPGAKLYFQQANYIQELRCSEDRYRTASISLMDANGKGLVETPTSDAPWKKIDNATVMRPISDLLCRNVVPTSSGPFADLSATKEAYFTLRNEGALKN